MNVNKKKAVHPVTEQRPVEAMKSGKTLCSQIMESQFEQLNDIGTEPVQ